MRLENDISEFMLKAAKFEFFLINKDIQLGRIEEKDNLQKLVGLDWGKLAVIIEDKHKFHDFDFKSCQFSYFKTDVPQYLVKSENGVPKWDSDEVTVDSWAKLLTRGYAQFRNNVAHGNKAQLPSAFTTERTENFLAASHALMAFIAQDIFEERDWERSLFFG